MQSATGSKCLSIPDSYLDTYYSKRRPGHIPEVFLKVHRDGRPDVRFKASNANGKSVIELNRNIDSTRLHQASPTVLQKLSGSSIDPRVSYFSSAFDGTVVYCYPEIGDCDLNYVNQAGIQVDMQIERDALNLFLDRIKESESVLEELKCT